MKKYSKNYIVIAQLAIVLFLSFVVVTTARAGSWSVNIGGTTFSFPTFVVKTYDPTYDLYKTFMSLMSSGVQMKAMPYALIQKLDPYYENNLNKVRYGHASRLVDTAITDCTKIYFSSKDMTDAIAKNTPLTASSMRWLLHELAHTEQCYKVGGREAYAKKWFKDLGTALITPPFSSNDMKEIHDKMPMEKAAEAKAVWVRTQLGI